jgi:hypothetical protein
VAFSNAVQAFPVLEKLDLSRNRLAHNSSDEKRVSGLESLCNVLWQVQTFRELRYGAWFHELLVHFRS